MAQTTVYTCDICKKSKDEKDLSRISVIAEGITIKEYNKYASLAIDFCKDCLREKGFIVEHKDEEEEMVKKQNIATLKDKLCEILEDMGVQFCE